MTVVRNSSDLQKTKDKIGQIFFDAAFGRQAVALPDNKVGIGPARQGTVLIDPYRDNFYIKKPSSVFTSVNMLRDMLGLEVPEFDYKKTGILSGWTYVYGSMLYVTSIA